MSVVRAIEPGPGKLSWRYENRKFVRRYTRHFEVHTNSDGDGAIQVLFGFVSLTGITLGSAYVTPSEGEIGVFCVAIEPEQAERDDPYTWHVAVEYSSEAEPELTGTREGDGTGSAGSGGNLAGDPLRRPPKFNYGFRTRKEVMQTDWTDATVVTVLGIDIKTGGRAIANAAGEPFDPPLEDDLYNLVITITRNVKAFDRDKARQYLGSVNVRAWQGFPARTARLVAWTADEQEENGILFFSERSEIEVQYPSWDIIVLNKGNYGYTSDDNYHLHQIKPDANGAMVGGQFLLDDKGQPLVNTKAISPDPINAGQRTVTVTDISYFTVGNQVIVDPDQAQEETVTITAVDTTNKTFTATFAALHTKPQIRGVPTYRTFQRRQTDFAKLKLPPLR